MNGNKLGKKSLWITKASLSLTQLHNESVNQCCHSVTPNPHKP